MTTWTKQKLGDVLEKVVGGGTPSKSNPQYWEGTIPWASVKDLEDGKYYLDATQDYITQEGLDDSASNFISAGTVVMPTRMGLGRVVKTTIDTAINQDLKAVYPNKKINNDFLLWTLIYSGNKLQTMGNGSTVSGIRLEDLRNIVIDVPDMGTQIQISSVLSAYNDLIENNQKRIKILEEMAQRLYTEWFVKFKFPGYEKVRMVDSGTEYGMIPEGWEVKSIDKICSKLMDGTHDSPKPTNRGYYLVTGKHIINGFLDFSSCYLISPEDHQKVMLRSRPEKGDVIFSNIGTLGSTVLVDQEYEFSIKNVALFKPLESEFSSFLYLYLSRVETLQYLIDKSSGTSQKFFSLGFLRGMKIIIPSATILSTFASIATTILNERSKLHITNIKLCQIRDLLIPQLVTGKRTLKI